MAKKEMMIKVGSLVQWKWLGRSINGIVKQIYLKSVSKEIKGKMIKRNGTEENPACLVESEAGNLALKLQSELQAQLKEKTKSVQPKIFSK